MKRKAFRTSGGKDRKAKKDKFVFTASDEGDSLPETETESNISEEIVQDIPRSSETISDAPNAEEAVPDMPHNETVSDIPSVETVSDLPHNESVTDVLQKTEAEKKYPADMQETIVIVPKDQESEAAVPAENDASDEEHSVPIGESEQIHIESEKFQENDSLYPSVENPKLQEAPQLPEPEVECDPNAPLPTFYNGPNLAELRKRCGVKLRAIWEATKIPIRTLENIESENYEALPPEVYVRSFIRTYASFLSVDPKKAMKDYMERYHIWKTEYEKQKRKSSLFSFGSKSSSFFGIRIKKS